MKLRSALLAAVMAAGALLATAAPATAAAPAASARGGVGTYHVTFYTGNLHKAGTDATVLLEVFGTNGVSPVVNLDNDEDNFERNKTDHFGPFNWQNVGSIYEVRVTKGGNGSEWFPGYVNIYSQHDGRMVHCAINTWYGDGPHGQKWACR